MSFKKKLLGRLFRGLGIMFVFFALIGFGISSGLQSTFGIIVSICFMILGIILGFNGIKKLHEVGEW